MGRYLSFTFHRLFQFALGLIFLVGLEFFLFKFFPGSPLSEESNLDSSVREQLEAAYGLHDSALTQAYKYFSNVLTGDLGISMRYPGRKVSSLIWEFGSTSLILGLSAFLIALLGSIVLILFVRRFQKKTFDGAILFLISLPNLALGPLLIWFFGLQLHLLPVALLEGVSSYIMPIFLLSLKPLLSLTRVLGASLDEVLGLDFIRTARALGFSEKQIQQKWALKNAMVSFITQTGPILATLISGSFLVEIMFAIPGLGFQFVDSALARDWPMILGLSLFYGILLMFSQLLSDLCLLKVDRRMAE